MVKVIVSDIDNTLVVTHEDMSKATKDTIKKIHDNGILFGIASGRQIVQVKQLVETWSIPVDFIIGANGCELLDLNTNEYETYFFMKKEWVKEILELMKPFNANAMMVKNGKQTVQKIDDKVLSSAKYMKSKPNVIKDSNEFCVECPKIMFRIDESQMSQCEDYLSKYPSKNYKGFKTQPSMIEFTNINASKGYALKQYCSNKKVDLKDTWAFGDTSNDNDMLEAAGQGICMKNGSTDTKAIADSITEFTCKDDGFAKYMNQHLFTK